MVCIINEEWRDKTVSALLIKKNSWKQKIYPGYSLSIVKCRRPWYVTQTIKYNYHASLFSLYKIKFLSFCLKVPCRHIVVGWELGGWTTNDGVYIYNFDTTTTTIQFPLNNQECFLRCPNGVRTLQTVTKTPIPLCFET